MKKQYGIILGIVTVLIVATAILSVLHLSGQRQTADQTVTISWAGEELDVDLATAPMTGFEGEMRRKVGEPTLHTFRGIALSELLLRAGIDIDLVTEVQITSEDNYSVTLLPSEITAGHNAYLITEMDGETLLSIDEDKRLPMLVVLQDEYATRWVKYTVLIEIL